MPVKETVILEPLGHKTKSYKEFSQMYKKIRNNLENKNYETFEDFYLDNDIDDDEFYLLLLRAGIKRPKCFLKRDVTEKWHNQYNPFVLSFSKSNTDLQLIIEEYSCAQYVVEYVNKSNRGISNLQQHNYYQNATRKSRI